MGQGLYAHVFPIAYVLRGQHLVFQFSQYSLPLVSLMQWLIDCGSSLSLVMCIIRHQFCTSIHTLACNCQAHIARRIVAGFTGSHVARIPAGPVMDERRGSWKKWAFSCMRPAPVLIVHLRPVAAPCVCLMQWLIDRGLSLSLVMCIIRHQVCASPPATQNEGFA